MPCFPQAAEPIGRVGRKCSERRCPMATQPEIPPPDRIDPQSPPETPPDSPTSEDPFRQPPDIVPDQPDYDKPDRGPIETPPPPDCSALSDRSFCDGQVEQPCGGGGPLHDNAPTTPTGERRQGNEG